MNEDEHHDALAHADRMDLRRIELEAEERKTRITAESLVEQERQRTKQKRAENWGGVGIAFAVATGIIGIGYLIFLGTTGPDEDAMREQESEQTCVENGGTWLDKSLLVANSHGLCVTPGQKVSQ